MPFELLATRGAAAGQRLRLDVASVLAVTPDGAASLRPTDSEADGALRAVLELRPGRVILCDLDGAGAARVRGDVVDFATLRAGDTFVLGAAEFMLESTGPSGSTTVVLPASEIVDVAGVRDAGEAPAGGRETPPIGLVRRSTPPVALLRRVVEVVETDLIIEALSEALPEDLERTADGRISVPPLTCTECGAVGPMPPGVDLADVAWICAGCRGALRMLTGDDPSRLGSYEIIRLAALGGMGAVYEAAAVDTGLHAAVKVMREEGTPEEIKRFAREQRIAQLLAHRHIVRCYEVGHHAGKLYIATEWVPGGDATQLMSATSPMRQVLRVGVDLFRALAYAHGRGVVHRDVKPANVLLTRPDRGGLRRARLADFGLAKRFANAELTTITRRDDTGGSMLMVGPEQLTDFKHVGPVADIHSGAATVFRMLTGATHLALRGPIDKVGIYEIGGAVLHTARTPLASLRREVPAPICELLDALLARDGAARERTTATAVADALEPWIARVDGA